MDGKKCRRRFVVLGRFEH
jgi:hypothetical protein